MIFKTEPKDEIAALREEVEKLREEVRKAYEHLCTIKWTDSELIRMQALEKSYRDEASELRKEWKELLMRLASR